MNQILVETLDSPFGGKAHLIDKLNVSSIKDMYFHKCGVDVSFYFGDLKQIGLYECMNTEYKFWRPEEIVGDEVFYKLLSAAWPNYYRTQRWEHSFIETYFLNSKNVLEIGCGPGYFLKKLENLVDSAIGIEFNQEAITNKVTSFDIVATNVEDLVLSVNNNFDVVYSFQVLEHLKDPCSFIKSALNVLNRNGYLIFSTPNNDYIEFQNKKDAFDLPPHHVGVFNPVIYKKIGDLFGLEVVDIIIESKFKIPFIGNKISIQSKVEKFFYNFKKNIGPNIIVIYKKN